MSKKINKTWLFITIFQYMCRVNGIGLNSKKNPRVYFFMGDYHCHGHVKDRGDRDHGTHMARKT